MKKILTAFLLVLIISCQNDDSGNIEPIDFREQNENDIVAFIDINDLDATRSNSGLHYVIEEQGEGTQPNSNSTVTVNYKGFFLNGNVFDQSDEEGATFNLQQVIAGWTEGITYFNEGGKGLLLIPSHLAYGSYDYNGIPGGSVLIFEIELLDVK